MSNLKSDANSMPRTDIELKPDKSVAEEDIYDEPRKLRCDVNYSVCREILNTERTHVKVQPPCEGGLTLVGRISKS